MSRKEIVSTQIRMPSALHRKLAKSAEESGRSLNAEIVWRLTQSLGEPEVFKQHEATEIERVTALVNALAPILKTPEVRDRLIKELTEDALGKGRKK